MIDAVKSSLCAFVALLLLAGCTTTDDRAPVTFTPSASPQPIVNSAKTISLNVVDNRGVEPDEIGAGVDLAGNTIVALRSTEPVREILLKAITEELKARNISVGSGAPTVDISITATHTIFVPEWPNGAARGIVAFAVTVRDAEGKTRFKERIGEVHKEPDVIARWSSNAALGVEGALAKAMKALFDNPSFTSALAGV